MWTLSDGMGCRLIGDQAKSEALLVYRGKHATTCLNARRAGVNIQIPVPGGEQHLHVVTEYKHLGDVIASNASIIPEMRHRTTWLRMGLLQ